MAVRPQSARLSAISALIIPSSTPQAASLAFVRQIKPFACNALVSSMTESYASSAATPSNTSDADFANPSSGPTTLVSIAHLSLTLTIVHSAIILGLSTTPVLPVNLL